MAPKALKRTGLVAGCHGRGDRARRTPPSGALVARLRHRDDPDAGRVAGPRVRRGPHPRQPRRRHDLHHQPRATARRSCSATASRCRRACGRSSSRRSRPPGSAPSRSTHRGHGESPRGETGHSLDNLADDLRTVLEELDLRDVVLVGHSMGGMAVQAFAIRHPDVVDERVRGLVLLSTSSHNLVSDATARARARSRGWSTSGPTSARSCASATSGSSCARIGFGDDPNPSHVEATREMLAACDKATTREAVVGAPAPRPHRGAAEASTCRRWSSVGTADALTPPRDARRIAELVPGARLVEYPGGGHMLMYERTDELDALIMDFARECQAGGGASARRRRHRRADVITDVPGVLAGHWTGDGHRRHRRGVPARDGRVRSRSAAARPRPRETAVLDPLRHASSRSTRSCSRGGSAFGLAAADGVMRALAEQGRGFPTAAGRCRSCPRRRSSTSSWRATSGPVPTRAAPRSAAALDPDAPPLATGRVGAGRRRERRRSGAAASTAPPVGSARASARDGDVVVAALVVVNAVGDIVDADGTPIVASKAPPGAPGLPRGGAVRDARPGGAGTNTTLAVVVDQRPVHARSSATSSPAAPTTAGPRDPPVAHPPRRRPRVRVRDRARSTPTSTGCASWSPRSRPRRCATRSRTIEALSDQRLTGTLSSGRRQSHDRVACRVAARTTSVRLVRRPRT